MKMRDGWRACLHPLLVILSGIAVCSASDAQTGIPGHAQEKILFEDAHARVVEVTRWPGGIIDVAAEAHPAIIAVDSPWPAVQVSGGEASAKVDGTPGRPPHGIVYPWCQVLGPSGAERVQVLGSFPQHFYRIEYKRIDGPDFSAHWRSWYPWILAPVRRVPDMGHTPQPGQPFSAEWPYPLVYNAVTAAPANHFVRYEDAHVQLVEVTVRPGETENMHGHPYRSVYANDGAGPTDPVPTKQVNKTLHPVSEPPWGSREGRGSALPGQAFPDCLAAAPEAPHQVYNPDRVPEHFFRLQFKRIDGDAIRTSWQAWYPRP